MNAHKSERYVSTLPDINNRKPHTLHLVSIIQVINNMIKACNVCDKFFEHQTDWKNHISVNNTSYNRFLLTHVVSKFQRVDNSRNKNFQNCKTKQNSIFEVF